MHTIKKVIDLFKRKSYIAYFREWEASGYRIKVYAHTLEGARMKAYRYLGAKNMIDITVIEL